MHSIKKRSFILSTAALLALAGCGGHADSIAHRKTLPPLPVRVGTVVSTVVTRGQPLPGTVYPTDQAVVAAKIMATVEETTFTIGQRVKTGEVLLKLRADELNARVEQAEAGLARIQRNFERESNLLTQGAATAETVRTLEDELRLAQARLAEAQTLLTYTQVEAPFDGIITSKSVRRGDLATPGSQLLTIEGANGYQVHVQVPDSLSSILAKEEIIIESRGEHISGRLAEWSPAADPASRSRLAKIDLPKDSDLRSGQYVRVIWPAAPAEVIEAPASAVSRLGQMIRVFTVEDGGAHLRFIRVGDQDNDVIRILAGLDAGELVVLDPSPELRDGQTVEIQP